MSFLTFHTDCTEKLKTTIWHFMFLLHRRN
jgi:hypothetical protein